jgi:hypothetical protein
MMPDGRRHTVFYPAGEIVEQTADTMLIRWRDAGIGANAVYQRAAYILDAAGLKIRWSPIFALTPADATVGPLTAETACDGDEVACYDHQIRGHY